MRPLPEGLARGIAMTAAAFAAVIVFDAAWHGLLAEPRFLSPAVHGSLVSTVYVIACLTCAFRVLQRRDIGR